VYFRSEEGKYRCAFFVSKATPIETMSTKTEKAADADAFSALGEALGSAAEKFEEGTHAARESAKEAARATRKVFAGGAYSTAYWISYGVVYSTVYLTELLPENSSFRRGLQEGASDAQAKLHHGKQKTESPEPSAVPTITTSKASKRPTPRQRVKKEG
jgi:hypothetical protein